MNKKKALVISGGGAFGAWGGGTIQGITECTGKEYDMVVGASTGSLLSPLVAIGKFEKLKEAYTSVNQDSIFDVNPFNKKGEIKLTNAIWRVLVANPISGIFKKKHKPTFGESNELRKTIKSFFTIEDFEKLKNSGKEIIAAVVNLNTELAEMKSSDDFGYEDFVDWIWISANAPLFMSLVTKNGCEYVDGGIVEHVPIQEAINKGATEIDVIIHRTEFSTPNKNYVSKNILDMFMKIVNVMHKEVSNDDVAISKLMAFDEDVTITYHYTPYKLSDNSLMFDKQTMTEWWDLGYKGIKESICKKKVVK